MGLRFWSSVLLGLILVAGAASPGQSRAAPLLQALDPASLLPAPTDLPPGFSHQPQYDRRLTEDGMTRVLRYYTRGHPELPTPTHASLLLVVAVGDSATEAAAEFQETGAAWERMGYGRTPLDGMVGEEAATGRELAFVETDHPKETVLLQFRADRVVATVQWTDNPGDVPLDAALTIARRIEARCEREDPNVERS